MVLSCLVADDGLMDQHPPSGSGGGRMITDDDDFDGSQRSMNDERDDTTGMAGAEPVPAAPPPPGPRRLMRSSNRKIAGVASGIAEYFAVDPVIVRLAFVVGLFAGGVGLVAYIAAWVVLPAPESSPREHSYRNVDPTTLFALLLLVIAAWIGFADPWDGGIVAPLLLVGAGIYLLNQRPAAGGPTVDAEIAGAAATVPSPPTTHGAGQGGSEPPPGSAVMAGRPDLPDDRQAPPAPYEPSVVTRFVLSALALLVAGAITVDRAGWLDVSTTTVIAIGLVIVGTGAVVGSVTGRARGLVPIGLLLALALAVANVIEPVFENGIGERDFAPTTLTELERAYELGIGDLFVDLRGLEIPEGEEVELDIELGIGEATVVVPSDIDLIVRGDLNIGELRLLDQTEEGFGNTLTVTRDAPGETTLIIDLDVGIGEGTVRRD